MPITHAQETLQALRFLTKDDLGAVYTRIDVREHLSILRERWESGYTAIFPDMRSDHPGGAPRIGRRYIGIINRFKEVNTDSHRGE
jgi:hypothetical protein